MWEGTTSRVMAADRPYGEFYDFYSVSPEYFGYTLVYLWNHAGMMGNMASDVHKTNTIGSNV
jgi:hypothetical protein